MKKIFVIIFILISLFIFGCWKKEQITITFDNYQFNLPWTDKNWLITSSAIIENKQIKEKILKILKPKDKNKKLNIIISYTTIKWNITFNDFINANIENFKKLFGYKLISLKTKTIDCKNKKIKIGIHRFKINQSILNQKDKIYYFSQIYIYQWDNWYIIQIVSENETTVKDYEKQIIDTLKCLK
jgi:hypothetical protein